MFLSLFFFFPCLTPRQLRGGWANEGMIDLTGCPGSRYQFDDEAVAADIRNGRFFDLIHEFDRLGYLMSASTPGACVWWLLFLFLSLTHT